MSHPIDYSPPRAYYMGRERRETHGSKVPPGTLSWVDRHWWLAGWNDRDMELTQ